MSKIPEYQSRVIKERNDLQEKYNSLNSFILSEGFQNMENNTEKERLVVQHSIMNAYLTIVNVRIDNF